MHRLFKHCGLLLVAQFLSFQQLAHAEPFTKRRLIFAPSPTAASFNAGQEATQIYLQDSTGAAVETLPEAVRLRLEAVFPPLEKDGLVVRSRDKWSFEIPRGRQVRPENEALVEAFSTDFNRCLRTLPKRELEGVKRILYNLSEALNIAGNLQLSTLASQGLTLMKQNYRLNRCAAVNDELPDLTVDLVQRYSRKFLSGNDPAAAVPDADIETFGTIFDELIFADGGVWQRVARDAVENEIRKGLSQLPRADKAEWMQRSYAGFIDFVLDSRRETRLGRDDYLLLSQACGVESFASIFQTFEIAQCPARDQLELVEIEVGGQPLGLILLESAQEAN